ncbi:uncharacterized protein [Antedon mediterranea]|uniref:uncharacterized protein n=1 Tax=Antedon mediterranea TaxID=105859 RepID=UPI003AF85562
MAEPNQPIDAAVTVIDCGEEVTFGDVHRLRATIGNENDDSNKLLDVAFNFVAKEPKWIFKDAEIAFSMPNHCYIMHSGKRTNQYVILIGESGQAEVRLRERGWKLFMRDQAVAIWNWAWENQGTIIGLAQLISILVGRREAIEFRENTSS